MYLDKEKRVWMELRNEISKGSNKKQNSAKALIGLSHRVQFEQPKFILNTIQGVYSVSSTMKFKILTFFFTSH